MQLTLYPAALTQERFEAGNASLCRLPFALAPLADRTINGDWSLTFAYPLGAMAAEQLALGMLVLASGQLYRIDSIERSSGREGERLSIHALHLVYDLRDKMIVNNETAEITPGGINQRTALQQVLDGSGFSDGEIDTDILLDYLDILQKDVLWAIKEQILPLWGGELQPDNWTINIRKQMGAEQNVHLRHGKNILGVKSSESLDGVVTRLHILGYQNANIESINDGLDYIDSANIGAYPTIREGLVTFSDDDLPEDLLSKGQEYLATVDTPRIKISVDLARIRTSEQYRHYKDLEQVALGDTVTVYHRRLGINITARVQSLRFDPVTGENERVDLGNDKRNLYSTIASAQQAAEVVKMITDRKGHVRSESLRGVLDLLTTQLMASGSFSDAQVIDGKGALFENTNAESADYGALYIGPGILAVANSKNEGGSWDWRTFGTGTGFYGDELVAGTVTVDKLTAGIGGSLDISANEAITSVVGDVDALRSEVQQTTDGLLITVGDFSGVIQALGTAITGLEGNQSYSDQYIQIGNLYKDAEGNMRVGVAIGENLEREEDLDGDKVLTKVGLAVTITPNRISFWQNQVEVAWFSDKQMFIKSINLVDTMQLGDWQIDHKYGFTIKWIGA